MALCVTSDLYARASGRVAKNRAQGRSYTQSHTLTITYTRSAFACNVQICTLIFVGAEMITVDPRFSEPLWSQLIANSSGVWIIELFG